jgi:hypothetical protein
MERNWICPFRTNHIVECLQANKWFVVDDRHFYACIPRDTPSFSYCRRRRKSIPTPRAVFLPLHLTVRNICPLGVVQRLILPTRVFVHKKHICMISNVT